MKKFTMLLSLALTAIFALAALAGDAKKEEKKPAAAKDSGKKDAGAKDAGKKDAPVEGEVYCTPNGKKCHAKKDCSTLKNSKEIKSMSKAEAEKMKLEPCKMCSGDKAAKKDPPKKGDKEMKDEKKAK